MPHFRQWTKRTVVALTLIQLTGCCSLTLPKPPPRLEGALIRCPEHSRLYVKFNYDGHMYTTFMVAVEAGMDPDDAAKLTYYSQLPDMDCRFDAVHVSIVDTFLPWKWVWREDINANLHSLHGGDYHAVERRRRVLSQLVHVTLQQGR